MSDTESLVGELVPGEIISELVLEDKPFKVDGVAIPTPTTYQYNIEDLSSEETGRTLDGVMHKDIVAVKDRYDCTWKTLSWEDAADLLNAINGKTTVQFTHADPRVPGRFVTHKFYVGQRNGGALNLRDPNHSWQDIAFAFIRV
jgi:hypothetical protein